eukprot:jgi/Botrbrau1/23338/Bobra.0815s0001.1
MSFSCNVGVTPIVKQRGRVTSACCGSEEALPKVRWTGYGTAEDRAGNAHLEDALLQGACRKVPKSPVRMDEQYNESDHEVTQTDREYMRQASRSWLGEVWDRPIQTPLWDASL